MEFQEDRRQVLSLRMLHEGLPSDETEVVSDQPSWGQRWGEKAVSFYPSRKWTAVLEN
jgi:hypothetical protein